MEWIDEGIIVSSRHHGESSSVICLFTKEHGRHAGLVRGARNKNNSGIYQLGNGVTARWRARLTEHLGIFNCEMTDARAARLIEDNLRLEGLLSICSLIEIALPERHPYPELYSRTISFLDDFEDSASWIQNLIMWELKLLADLGFGLDLSVCALTGEKENLAYVSPRTGRAVTFAAGEPYREKLLSLPKFTIDQSSEGKISTKGDISAGLKLTEWFISRHLLSVRKTKMPAARNRLAKRWKNKI
ncbi:MAG: DNA repair protein RecO [Alphaproteobacteria bacterium]|nr:DNA repair protein RecO [Alphaproteobacteria bacterium]|tara:strand:+ start:885 stop:1619 length:735 start_codon:yes stop_codon:yes gene_type:complete